MLPARNLFVIFLGWFAIPCLLLGSSGCIGRDYELPHESEYSTFMTLDFEVADDEEITDEQRNILRSIKWVYARKNDTWVLTYNRNKDGDTLQHLPLDPRKAQGSCDFLFVWEEPIPAVLSQSPEYQNTRIYVIGTLTVYYKTHHTTLSMQSSAHIDTQITVTRATCNQRLFEPEAFTLPEDPGQKRIVYRHIFKDARVNFTNRKQKERILLAKENTPVITISHHPFVTLLATEPSL